MLAVDLSGWAVLHERGWSLLITAAVTLLLAIGAPAAMLARASRPPSWAVPLATAAGAAALAAVVWTQVEALRSVI